MFEYTVWSVWILSLRAKTKMQFKIVGNPQPQALSQNGAVQYLIKIVKKDERGRTLVPLKWNEKDTFCSRKSMFRSLL